MTEDAKPEDTTSNTGLMEGSSPSLLPAASEGFVLGTSDEAAKDDDALPDTGTTSHGVKRNLL